MKAVLSFLAALGILVALFCLSGPGRGAALAGRAFGYFRLVPGAPAETAPGHASSNGGAAPAAVPAVPEWVRADREASRLYEAGEFGRAAALWGEAMPRASPTVASHFRARADRARVFEILSTGAAASPVGDVDAAEREYRRRLDAMERPSAGGFLDLAAFAGEKGLRRHLAYLYERAFERRTDGTGAVDRAVAGKYRERREARGAPSREIAEAVVREVPAGEAAEVAAADTGGLGGVAPNGNGNGSPTVDGTRLAEAKRLKSLGDAEYRAAVPGSKDVNVHRRAALDAFFAAREIYEELDRDSGRNAYQRVIHDLNRNIAELRKDLPVGK